MGNSDTWKDPEIKKALKAGKFLLIAIGIVLLAILLGFLIQFLWNQTIAVIFGIPTISYWQAVGLFILSKFFFGFGGGSSNKQRSHKRKHKGELAAQDSNEPDPTSDSSFQEYWEQEGKEAYDAYLTTRNDDSKEESDHSNS
ncbi:MAG: hypothetical protein GKR91_08910 [Pseudomonadales bacterium]|nr:hypothetical protein [Pseudomonadales bacterium]